MGSIPHKILDVSEFHCWWLFAGTNNWTKHAALFPFTLQLCWMHHCHCFETANWIMCSDNNCLGNESFGCCGLNSKSLLDSLLALLWNCKLHSVFVGQQLPSLHSVANCLFLCWCFVWDSAPLLPPNSHSLPCWDAFSQDSLLDLFQQSHFGLAQSLVQTSLMCECLGLHVGNNGLPHWPNMLMHSSKLFLPDLVLADRWMCLCVG